MTRIALGVQYVGTAWNGYQKQPSRDTVQDQLEIALEKFACTRLATSPAGRTDAGVHAIEQVVHFDTDLDRAPQSWVRGTNAFLPKSNVVRWALVGAPDVEGQDVHARFSARSRTYVYLLWRGRVRPALWAGRAGWCFQALDLDAMRQAAQALLGEHDFSSFRSAQCQARHPVRTLQRLDIDERGPFVVFTLRANAFLHHMVRNLVGALLQVGQGRESATWMAQLLQARDRRLGAPTFMADGLYLCAIEYAESYELPELDGGATLLWPFTSTR